MKVVFDNGNYEIHASDREISDLKAFDTFNGKIVRRDGSEMDSRFSVVASTGLRSRDYGKGCPEFQPPGGIDITIGEGVRFDLSLGGVLDRVMWAPERKVEETYNGVNTVGFYRQ